MGGRGAREIGKEVYERKEKGGDSEREAASHFGMKDAARRAVTRTPVSGTEPLAVAAAPESPRITRLVSPVREDSVEGIVPLLGSRCGADG